MFKDDVERCDDFSNIAGLENKTAAEKPAELEAVTTLSSIETAFEATPERSGS